MSIKCSCKWKLPGLRKTPLKFVKILNFDDAGVFQITQHNFGVTLSPCDANFAVQQTAADKRMALPMVTGVVFNGFCVFGCNSTLLQSCCSNNWISWNLKLWSSQSSEIGDSECKRVFVHRNRGQFCRTFFRVLLGTSVLGLSWNVKEEDSFSVTRLLLMKTPFKKTQLKISKSDSALSEFWVR